MTSPGRGAGPGAELSSPPPGAGSPFRLFVVFSYACTNGLTQPSRNSNGPHFPSLTGIRATPPPLPRDPRDPAAATAAVTGGLSAGGAQRPEPRGGEPSGSAAPRPRPSQPQRPPGHRGERGAGRAERRGPAHLLLGRGARTGPGAPRNERKPRPRSPRRESAAAAPPPGTGPPRPPPRPARCQGRARRPRRASSLRRRRRRRRAPLTARARCGHLLTEPAGPEPGGTGRPRCRDRDAASLRRSRTRHVMFGSRGSIHEAPGATAPRLKGDARFCRRRRGEEGGAAT